MPRTQFTCIDAGQIPETWGGSATLSINIIYSLLALLIALMIPLTLIHCWGRRVCRRRASKPNNNLLHVPVLAETRVPSSLSNSSILDPSHTILDQSPTIGVYNVTSGAVIHPATVKPSTLRSFSASHNSFKSFHLPPVQPLSLHSWSSEPPPSTHLHVQSLPVGFNPHPRVKTLEPKIDESGYATLIIKPDPSREPFYEQVPPDHITEQQAMYDDVPRRYSVHEYMNSSVALGGEEQVMGSEQDSFPDLLQMVTKSKTPSPVVKARTPSDNTDVAQLYAKVIFKKNVYAPIYNTSYT